MTIYLPKKPFELLGNFLWGLFIFSWIPVIGFIVLVFTVMDDYETQQYALLSIFSLLLSVPMCIVTAFERRWFKWRDTK